MRAPTVQQLRGTCAVVDAGFSVSRAASRLNTTQSAVSKTIKALEDELGVAIFVRSSVRLEALTDYGHEFVGIARGILRDIEFAVARAQDDGRRGRGVLRIGTTHTHAIYALPKVVQAFRARYPDVVVELEEGTAAEVAQWVSSRRVHMGIAACRRGTSPGLITLAAMRLGHCIVVPRGHELLTLEKPTLADLVRYPIVAQHELRPAGTRLRKLFQQHGLTPRIAATGPNATALKAYVAAGMGVAILYNIAIGPEDQSKLALIDASHLLPASESHLIFREGEYLRPYVYDFTEAFAPEWSRHSLTHEIQRRTACAA